jgi:phosphoglycolate phosphatase-like HAD superfamily hydrolase
MTQYPRTQDVDYRLVLWNIGLTLVDAARVLRAFDLDRYLDTEIGGYGSGVYPKGAMLLDARGRAAEKYRADFTEHTTVYIADSTRDVEAARIGGARSIGIASGRSAAGELRDAGADLVLDDLADTEAVLAAVDRLTTPIRS